MTHTEYLTVFAALLAIFLLGNTARSQTIECGNVRFKWATGTPYESIKKDTKCIEHFRKSWKKKGVSKSDINRGVADFYCSRGKAYRMIGQYNRSLQELDKTIEYNPDDHCGYWERGLTYEAKGLFNKAYADLSATLARFTDKSDDSDLPDFFKAAAYADRADIERQRGNLDAAMADANRAFAIYPSSHKALVVRGKTHLAAGRIDTAIKDFQSALKATTVKTEKLRVNRLIWNAEHARKQ